MTSWVRSVIILYLFVDSEPDSYARIRSANSCEPIHIVGNLAESKQSTVDGWLFSRHFICVVKTRFKQFRDRLERIIGIATVG